MCNPLEEGQETVPIKGRTADISGFGDQTISDATTPLSTQSTRVATDDTETNNFLQRQK